MSEGADAARSALVVLRRRVDDHFAAAVARQPQAFACRAGCSSCCAPGLSVFALEGASIAAALAELDHDDPRLRATVRAQAHDPEHASCALLVAGRCSVYEHRPLVCRSHGLAIARAEGDELVVEHCALNYTEVAPAPASVLRSEAMLAPLSLASRMFDGIGERVTLAELARR